MVPYQSRLLTPLPQILRFERCLACGILLVMPGGLCTYGCEYDGQHLNMRPPEMVAIVTYRVEGEPASGQD